MRFERPRFVVGGRKKVPAPSFTVITVMNKTNLSRASASKLEPCPPLHDFHRLTSILAQPHPVQQNAFTHNRDLVETPEMASISSSCDTFSCGCGRQFLSRDALAQHKRDKVQLVSATRCTTSTLDPASTPNSHGSGLQNSSRVRKLSTAGISASITVVSAWSVLKTNQIPTGRTQSEMASDERPVDGQRCWRKDRYY
jgi:hypothetical protein